MGANACAARCRIQGSDRRVRRCSLALISLALLCASSAAAQKLPANARLPLQHWTTPFLEHLARTGVITDPSPLMRPWRVGDIATALAAADTLQMTSAERRTRGAILDVLQASSSEEGLVGGVDVGVVTSTHQRRPEFSLRPKGTDRVTPEASGLFGFWFGPALLMVHARYNEDLEDDPDYAGLLGQVEIRTQEAYGAFQSRYLAVELGNISRNWGPPGFPGLLVSDWPLSYDHLFVRLGPQRIHMNIMVAQLDDALDGRGELSKRFFVAHRLAARLWPWLDLAFWQGTVLTGPNRNLELWYLNPIQPTYFARNQQGQEGNINFLYGVDGQMRLGRFVLSGSAFLDDFDFPEGEPAAFGLTATATTSFGAASMWLGYTLVSNLAYNTNDPAEKVLIALDPARGRVGNGLARNFSDYDQLTIRATVVPFPGLIVGPELTLLRQGEGDLRLPFPTRDQFDETPTLFVGVVERTWRAGLVSTLHLPLGVTAHLNVGVHRIVNAGHQTGASQTEFVGTALLRYGLWHIGPFD